MGRQRIHSYLAPTVEFNPTRNQDAVPNVSKEYFTRHNYLSRKHNCKGLHKAIYKCGPNLDTQFRVQVFVEFYVYTPSPPYIHMSICRYLPIFTCFSVVFKCIYCIVIALPLPILPDVYVCCHGNANLQTCRTWKDFLNFFNSVTLLI